MQVHRFGKKGTKSTIALSADRAGANLPGGPSAWNYEQAMDINPHETVGRLGVDADPILDAVEKDGYCVMDENTAPHQR